jgi:hypothetical protein
MKTLVIAAAVAAGLMSGTASAEKGLPKGMSIMGTSKYVRFIDSDTTDFVGIRIRGVVAPELGSRAATRPILMPRAGMKPTTPARMQIAETLRINFYLLNLDVGANEQP